MTDFGWTPGSASSSGKYWSKWNSEGAPCPDVPERKGISVQSLNKLSEILEWGRTHTGIWIFLESFVCFEEQNILDIVIIHVSITSLIVPSIIPGFSTWSVNKRTGHKCKTYSSATSDDWDRSGVSSGWGSLRGWLLMKEFVINARHTQTPWRELQGTSQKDGEEPEGIGGPSEAA